MKLLTIALILNAIAIVIQMKILRVKELEFSVPSAWIGANAMAVVFILASFISRW